MAGGFRGIQDASGVWLGGAPASAVAGLTVLQASGVWITGAPTGVVAVAGLTALQSMGVWITGAPAPSGATAGLTVLQAGGVWITGAPAFLAAELAEDGTYRGEYIRRHNEFLLAVLVAAVEVINGQS